MIFSNYFILKISPLINISVLWKVMILILSGDFAGVCVCVCVCVCVLKL